METGRTLDEVALLERFRDGDEEAFRVLFARHADRLERRIARGIPPRLRRRFDVADVLQETRLVAFRRHADFEVRGGDAFGRWVDGIADHKLSEAVRAHAGTAKRSAFREVARHLRADTDAMPAHGPTPSEIAISHEVMERARRAFDRLSPEDQELIRWTRRQGFSLEEVARRTGRTHDAARRACGRAVCRFAAAYDALGHADAR